MARNTYIFLKIEGTLSREIAVILKFPSALHHNFKYVFSKKNLLRELKQCLELRQNYLRGISDTLGVSNFKGKTYIPDEDIQKNEDKILEIFNKMIQSNANNEHSLKNEIQFHLRRSFEQTRENSNYSQPKIFICCEDPILDSFPWRKLEMFSVEGYSKNVEIVLSPFHVISPSRSFNYVDGHVPKVLVITDPKINFNNSLEILNKFYKQTRIELSHKEIDSNDPYQLGNLLKEIKPHILILLGHSQGYRLLDGSNIQDLYSHLIEAVEQGLSISIVNSCASSLIGREMSRYGVQHVVAMSWEIRNQPANDFFKFVVEEFIGNKISFSSSFHSAIGKIRPANKEHPFVSLNPVIYEHIPDELSLDFLETVDRLKNGIKQTNDHIKSFQKLANSTITELKSEIDLAKNNFWIAKKFPVRNNFLLVIVIAISSFVSLGFILFLSDKFKPSVQNIQSNKEEQLSVNTTQNLKNSVVQVIKSRDNIKINLTGFIFYKNIETGNHYFITTNYGQSSDTTILRIEDFSQNAYKVFIDEVNSTDIAVFEFQVCKTNKNFKMIDFADSNEIRSGSTLYAFGIIPTISNPTKMNYTSIPIHVIDVDTSTTLEGYSLSYSLRTRKSMNGSPLLTSRGKLAGMHALADSVDITQVQPLVQENKDIEADSFRFAQGVSLEKLQGIRSKVEEFDLKNTKSCK